MSTRTESNQQTVLEPFIEQEPFLRDDHTYYGYISGVGAGKTFAGIIRTVLNVEEWNSGEMGAIVAPTTTMIKDVIIPQMREIGLLNHWKYKGPHSDEPGLHAPNGSRILLLSADNSRTIERLAGLNLAWWWLDEASRVPKRALEILTQRLRIGAYRNGFISTTPMGKDHIYDFFVGDVDGKEDYHGEADLYVSDTKLSILRVPTWSNPHTPDDYKQQMENKEGQVYEREILGRFVDYEGLIYQWFNHQDHVKPIDSDEFPHDRIRSYIYGVDWGFNNPSVCLAIGLGTDDQYIVIDEIYQSGLTTKEFAQAVGSLQQQYGTGPIYCDPAEPASIETFRRHGLDAKKAINDIMPGIQKITEKRNKLTVSDHCQNLINEFGAYRYPDNSDGEMPIDAHNHALDCLRYALMTHDKQGGWNIGVAFG